ncbi:hypothetical protein Trydic_g4137 [Trypoxylus dichotomus]
MNILANDRVGCGSSGRVLILPAAKYKEMCGRDAETGKQRYKYYGIEKGRSKLRKRKGMVCVTIDKRLTIRKNVRLRFVNLSAKKI